MTLQARKPQETVPSDLKIFRHQEQMRVGMVAFLQKAKARHGDRYDYSEVVYLGTKTPVRIGCPEHGFFGQKPEKHMEGHRCPACGEIQRRASKTHSLEKFIEKSRRVHGDWYDYSNSVYRGSKQPIDIICPDHGNFSQIVEYHYDGNGCQACAEEKKGSHSRLDLETFLARFRETHGDRYEYPDAEYTCNSALMKVVCRDHGEFEVGPHNHWKGVGCRKCAIIKRAEAQRRDDDYFLECSTARWGDRYDYSRSIYTGAKSNIEVVCRDHGPFLVEASAHHVSGVGCPSCNVHYSKPHQDIELFLTEQTIEFTTNSRLIIRPKELDIYIESHKLAIEVNGIYWHSFPEEREETGAKAHFNKFVACRRKGITLLQITDYEWLSERTGPIWRSIIRSKLGIQKRIAGRDTQFSVISREEANTFLDRNHLQGSTKSRRWCFGLKHQSEIVAVMTFAMHEKTQIAMTRMAFALGTTIVGGARKLMKNALALLPKRDVVTFSSNSYSDGGVYAVMGFHKDADLPPSYQWFFRSKVWNKRHMRHHRLQALLGEDYNPDHTERVNMFRAGARCLYDAGYQRWVLPNSA